MRTGNGAPDPPNGEVNTMRSMLVLALLASFGTSAFAKLNYEKNPGPISLQPGFGGSALELPAHYRVFVVGKNVGKANELVVFSELDANCTFKQDRNERGQPSFDFYWWMENRKFFKNPAPALRPYMREELKVVGNGANGSFSIVSSNIAKLDQLEVGGNPNFTVKAEKKDGKCEVNAYITIKGKTIRVNSMYVHGEKAGLFNQDPSVCRLIINEGEDTQVVLNGDKAQKGYQAACRTPESLKL